MNGQMLNYKRYMESLSHMTQPVMPSELPKIKMDLAGLSKYAKDKGTTIQDLSAQEISMFIPELRKK